MSRVTLTFAINGRLVRGDGGAHFSLLRWLREVAGVSDPKYGCGEGVCGACTVLADGLPVASCIVLAAQLDGATITTAAGLGGPDGLSPLQRAFQEHHAARCGLCTSGVLVAAAALLADGCARSRAELQEELDGYFCLCTGQGPILDAIESAQRELAAAPPPASDADDRHVRLPAERHIAPAGGAS